LHKYKKFTNRFGNNVLNGNNRKPNGRNATMKSAKPENISFPQERANPFRIKHSIR